MVVNRKQNVAANHDDDLDQPVKQKPATSKEVEELEKDNGFEDDDEEEDDDDDE